jgi:hypothetical protein
MRATLFGALFVSALDTTFLAQRAPESSDANSSSDAAYERNLPSQGTFLEKSHETIQHIRADLKDLFKTVGELRTADLDEVSRQRQNFESQLHSQEDEVKREALANVKLQQDNDAILEEVHKLEDQKKELVEENSQLEKKLKDLKGQVEQEVSGMEALLGSGARESSILQEASIVDKSDEESADDADKSDDDGKDDDASDDKDSKDDDDSDAEDAKDDAKADSKDDAKDDASDDDKDDSDDQDDDDESKAKSLVKTAAKSDSKASSTADKKVAESDDDEDDDSDKDDDSDDKEDDDAGSSENLVQVDAEPCKCTTPCNTAAKPICFVESSTCALKQKCDKGGKGNSCIKTDPVKGPWTFCANLLNVTGAPPQVHHNLLPENPNVAVVMRMMADIRREVAGITGEDEEGASRLRDSYKDEKTKEERKHKEVMTQQKELQRVQEEDLARKSKLLDEVHALQERNKNLRQQVDRIGEFLRAESSKLSDAVTAANNAKDA